MTEHSEDYQTWEGTVRPTFLAIAASGRPFVTWAVAKEYRLPEPPDRRRDWAQLMIGLHREGLVRRDGFGYARDHSAVTRWRGTRAARFEQTEIAS